MLEHILVPGNIIRLDYDVGVRTEQPLRTLDNFKVVAFNIYLEYVAPFNHVVKRVCLNLNAFIRHHRQSGVLMFA